MELSLTPEFFDSLRDALYAVALVVLAFKS